MTASRISGKTFWLVGASEGLGRAVAHELVARGARVIVSARSAARLEQLACELGEAARAVPVDVSDAKSVRAAAEAAGEIDGMVYLAAVYWPFSAREWNAEQADAMAEVNYIGASRAVGAVINEMVARNRGHIVLTGSLSAYGGLPGAIGYVASKAGLMALAESMYADLRKTGVRVQLINPGYIRTRLTDKNSFEMPFILDPEPAAKLFADHMERGGFKKDYPLLFSLVFRLSRFLPNWAYFRLFGGG